MSGWIGVDLDGTLAHYDGWKGIEHIGAPVWPMLTRVKQWLHEGRDVKIFTARVSAGGHEGALVRHYIWKWCEEHGLPLLEITNVKDFAMLELWDDRAVQVRLNEGQPVGQSTRELV
jgi:hypothetical protein